MATLEVKDAGGTTRKLRGRYDGDEFIPENESSVKGGTIVVGATTFQVDGRVAHGLSADRPTAVAMHAVLPFAYYNAVDTQVLSQTDGTTWQTV